MSKSWVPEWMMQLDRKPKARRPEPTWTTKDGRVIPVRLMDNGHLLNTIRLLERMADTEVGYAAAFAELDLGPDAYEWVSECSDPGDKYPIYKHLIAEAARRGLDLSMPAFVASRVATPDEFPG